MLPHLSWANAIVDKEIMHITTKQQEINFFIHAPFFYLQH